MKEIAKFINEAKALGVSLNEKFLSLGELLAKLTEDSLLIVLLDWNIVRGFKEKGYQGHFVPVVGYDKENVYVHNHGKHEPKPFYPISKKTFDEARKAEGTDEDIVVIYRN